MDHVYVKPLTKNTELIADIFGGYGGKWENYFYILEAKLSL